MLDNLDMGIIINKEWDRDGNMYMVFSVIKKRVKNVRDYIAQPFALGSEIRLMEDVHLNVPVFKESLRSMGNLVRNDNTIRASAYSNIIDTNDVFTSDDTNIFDPNNSYSSDDFGTDFTPLTSDIPDYSKVTTPSENVKKEPKKEKIDPIIMYNLPSDPQSLLDDLKSVLG
jgi:subtilase family serine protease